MQLKKTQKTLLYIDLYRKFVMRTWTYQLTSLESQVYSDGLFHF